MLKFPFYDWGQRTISQESQALQQLSDQLDERFAQVCQYLMDCHGHIIVTGVGKSGHIARKIAATFSSTGTPAFFIHATEAGHGDLGMITETDIVLALSYSGETEVLLHLLPSLQARHIPVIALTGHPNSSLARQATLLLPVLTTREACPLGLAPTVSTTSLLAMGDALAMALMQARGMNQQDFAQFHPSGALGNCLNVSVADLMRRGQQLPLVKLATLLPQVIVEMSLKQLGLVFIINDQQQLVGVFTDGDLRRVIERQLDFYHTVIDTVMSKSCKTITADQLASVALYQMEQYKITSLAVIDHHQRPVGVLHIHDVVSKCIQPMGPIDDVVNE